MHKHTRMTTGFAIKIIITLIVWMSASWGLYQAMEKPKHDRLYKQRSTVALLRKKLEQLPQATVKNPAQGNYSRNLIQLVLDITAKQPVLITQLDSKHNLSLNLIAPYQTIITFLSLLFKNSAVTPSYLSLQTDPKSIQYIVFKGVFD